MPGNDNKKHFNDLVYKGLKNGDKSEKMMEAYAKAMYDDEMSTIIQTVSVHKNTILHLAIDMGKEDIAKAIVSGCYKEVQTSEAVAAAPENQEKYVAISIDVDSRCSGTSKEARTRRLKERNAFGNTVLHEAVAARPGNMISLVKDLLSAEPALLSIHNDNGEMPLYTAACYGMTNSFILLAEKLHEKKLNEEQLDDHLIPFGKDPKRTSNNIFHAAIHAEFFGLALLIAKLYPRLVSKKDKDGMTGLQLLSSNSSAFKSGTKHGLIESFIYNCAPYEKDLDEKEVAHLLINIPKQQRDQQSDPSDDADAATSSFIISLRFLLRQVVSSVNKSVWKNILLKWGKMEKIYVEKKGHGSAFELAKYLIPGDFSWDTFTITTEGRTGVEGQTGPIYMSELTKDASNGVEGQTEPIDMSELTKDASNGSDDSYEDNLDYEDNSVEGQTEPIDMSELTKDASNGSDDSYEDNLDYEDNWDRPQTPLLLAIRNGITEIVDEILRVFPLAIEHLTPKVENNILHIAVKHRQWHIFDTLTRMKLPLLRLARRINNRNCTILHQVGNMTYYRGTQAGPALQLQEELEWFENVKRIVPGHFMMQSGAVRFWTLEEKEKEKMKMTHWKDYFENETKKMVPWEYFRETHSGLLTEAQEWLERTAQSCSMVAGLIATVAFAAAFTVPGGNDDQGHPILINHPFFFVFIVTDALSLASSLTSLVMFLSILTSPFELKDFHHKLPRMLISGFTFLFFSVGVTMFAFASTLMLVISTNKPLATYLVYCIAFLPVSMFAILQFPIDRTTFKKFLKAIQGLPLISYSFPKPKIE